MVSTTGSFSAVRDFRHARSRANRERLMARVSGKAADLFCYEDVRDQLGAQAGQSLGLMTIPLDAIVGSVGRCTDFSRSFFPLKDGDQQRWTNVQMAAASQKGLPPIKAYRLGHAYFVVDGNHRVSVARHRGLRDIEAMVTEICTRVPVSPHDRPEDLLLKVELSTFLRDTRLDRVRPEARLSVTQPGQAAVLRGQIDRHHSALAGKEQRQIPYEDAVGGWYDEAYKPLVQFIGEWMLAEELPGLSETEIYLLLCEHRESIEEALGWQVEPEVAAEHFVRLHSPRAWRKAARAGKRILDTFTPDPLRTAPEARRDRSQDDCLFSKIVVAVDGRDAAWPAVAQAAEIACREQARLLGVHVVSSESEREAPPVQEIEAEFTRHSQAVGADATMAVEVGSVASQLAACAWWADLTILNLAHPPELDSIAQRYSALSGLIRRCPTPVMVVPGAFSPLRRPLLAFDGSPKAREALYVAAYLAQRSQARLTVVSVAENGVDAVRASAEASSYLDSLGLQATLIQPSGPAAHSILEAASEHGNDLIVMGGYGHSPLVELVLGGTVDRVLQASKQPVLICK